jgi:hypothetical protein
MKSLKIFLTISLRAIIFLGIFVGMLFVFQVAITNLLPSTGSTMESLASYPEPGSTPVNDLLPTVSYPDTLTPTPTPIVLDNGWYLFVDNDAGYSLSYPPDAFFHTSQEGRLAYQTAYIQFNIPDAGYQGIEINVLPNTKNLPLESIVQEVNANDHEKPAITDVQASLKPVMIGKLSAFKSVYQPSIAEFRIFVPYENKVLYATPVTTMGLSAFTPEAQELFEKILATLTINP